MIFSLFKFAVISNNKIEYQNFPRKNSTDGGWLGGTAILKETAPLVQPVKNNIMVKSPFILILHPLIKPKVANQQKKSTDQN